MTAVIAILVAALGAVIVVAVLVKMMWKVAEPNEALIVSGLGAGGRNESVGLGFRVVVGKGTLVVPGLQTVRRLSLALHKSDLTVSCVTTQGIPVHVRGVVVYKVGDQLGEIANAARRFLDKEGEMDTNVHEVFAGHLRSIVGSLTVEDMIRARERLASETRNSSAIEMEKLGLVIDSLQIQEIDDPTKYIVNLARPYQAAVESAARIAAAERDREATEREQAAAALAALATGHASPVVVMGDLNTLSPLDAPAHAEADLVAVLREDASLRRKFLSADGLIDYRPMRRLLAAGLHDPGAAVAGDYTVPTPINDDTTHVARMRLDYVLVNAALLARAPMVRTLRGGEVDRLSDHYPVECAWDE